MISSPTFNCHVCFDTFVIYALVAPPDQSVRDYFQVARWSLRCVTFQVMSARPGQRPNGLPRDKICQFKLVLLGECVHVTFCTSFVFFLVFVFAQSYSF